MGHSPILHGFCTKNSKVFWNPAAFKKKVSLLVTLLFKLASQLQTPLVPSGTSPLSFPYPYPYLQLAVENPAHAGITDGEKVRTSAESHVTIKALNKSVRNSTKSTNRKILGALVQ